MEDTESENSRKKKNRQASELSSEYNNPCLKEHKMAMKCSLNNSTDKDKCKAYFSNYRTCREFWDSVKSDRRINGIYPFLPVPEDRPRIKEEYLSKRMHNQ